MTRVKGYTIADLPNGSQVYLCDTCERPIGRASLTAHRQRCAAARRVVVSAEAFGFTWYAVGASEQNGRFKLVDAVERYADRNGFGLPYEGRGVEAFRDWYGFGDVLDLDAGDVFNGSDVVR